MNEQAIEDPKAGRSRSKEVNRGVKEGLARTNPKKSSYHARPALLARGRRGRSVNSGGLVRSGDERAGGEGPAGDGANLGPTRPDYVALFDEYQRLVRCAAYWHGALAYWAHSERRDVPRDSALGVCAKIREALQRADGIEKSHLAALRQTARLSKSETDARPLREPASPNESEVP